MTIDCSAWELRVSSCIACCRPGTSMLAVRASTAVRWMTSSPMECMRASRRSASTRTVRAAPEALGAAALAARRLSGRSGLGTAPERLGAARRGSAAPGSAGSGSDTVSGSATGSATGTGLRQPATSSISTATTSETPETVWVTASSSCSEAIHASTR